MLKSKKCLIFLKNNRYIVILWYQNHSHRDLHMKKLLNTIMSIAKYDDRKIRFYI